MTKLFETGIGKTSVKAFNEGRITLWFYKKRGGIIEKEYNSKAWAVKAIQKVKSEGMSLRRVTTYYDRIILTFSRKGEKVEFEYRQYAYGDKSFTATVVCRPMASWDIGFRDW